MAVWQSSPGIWASTALAAATFFMVISLYLLGEQKMRPKGLNRVGRESWYLGDIGAWDLLPGPRQSNAGADRAVAVWGWTGMENSPGFPPGHGPLIEIYWRRDDAINTVYTPSEDFGLRISPRFFLMLFSLTISSVRHVHPCTWELGWTQKAYTGLCKKIKGSWNSSICLLVLNPWFIAAHFFFLWFFNPRAVERYNV